VLSYSPYGWGFVPSAADDGCGTPIRFEACWNGTHVIATAIAHADQVTIVPVPGALLEIPLDLFELLVAQLIVAAHSKPSPPP
jgi:hypothetical protein